MFVTVTLVNAASEASLTIQEKMIFTVFLCERKEHVCHTVGPGNMFLVTLVTRMRRAKRALNDCLLNFWLSKCSKRGEPKGHVCLNVGLVNASEASLGSTFGALLASVNAASNASITSMVRCAVGSFSCHFRKK
jgi:hypothetical protein